MTQAEGQAPYCSFRSRHNCQGDLVGKRVKTRIRDGKVQTFTYVLCEHHDKVAKR